MKKLLTFFAMVSAILLLPVNVSAWWDVDANHPGTIMGNHFQDVDGNTIQSWDNGAGIPLVWVSSASEARCLIKATGTEAYIKFSVWDDYANQYKGHSYANDYTVSTTSTFTSTFAESGTQTVLKGLTAGKLYQVCLKQADSQGSGVQMRVRPIPDELYIFGSASEWNTGSPNSTSNVGKLNNDGKGKFTFSGKLTNSSTFFKISSDPSGNEDNGWRNFNNNCVTNQTYTDNGTFLFSWPESVGEGHSKVAASGNWTITFDFATGLVTSAMKPVYEYLYIREYGGYNNNSSNVNYIHDADGNELSKISNFPVVKGENNIFVFELSINAESYFKLATSAGNNTFVNPKSDNDRKMSASGTQAILLKQSGSTSFDPQTAGIWRFTVDLDNETISYTWREARPAKPVIEVNGETNKVTITCSTADVQIYYTIDGSDPNKNSIPYANEFNLDRTDKNITIKARAYKGDKFSELATKENVSYTSHPPTGLKMDNNGDNTLTLESADPTATIYWVAGDGSGLVEPYADHCDGSGVGSVTVTVPEAGFPAGISFIAVNEDGASALKTYANGIKYVIPAPTIEVVQEGDRYFAVITNVYGKGQMTYNVNDIESTVEASDATQVKVELTKTCTITASVTAFGVGTSDPATATWENPADKKPIYYVAKSKGWEKTVNGSTKPNAIAIPWDAKQKAYVFSIVLTTTGSDDTFRLTNADDVSSWTNIYAADKVATLEAIATAGDSKTATLSNVNNSDYKTGNFNVKKIGYYTIKVDGDFNNITYTWDGPLSEDVTVKGWSLTTAADWKDKPSRYFYLSGEQNDSRVSPEWELEETSKGSGIYAINDFMVIPAGQFIIREIKRNVNNGNVSFEIHDWGYGDDAMMVNSAALGIPTTGDRVASGTYATTEKMTDNAKRGFFWNIGYTMASVRVNPNGEALKPVKQENDGRSVIYYKGNLSNPALWLWENNKDGNLYEFDDKDENGYWYYKIPADLTARTNVIIRDKSNWNDGNQTGTLTYTAGQQVVCYEKPSSFTSYDDYEEANSAGMQISLTADLLNNPSTLKVAKKQGMPYVAFMGELFGTQLGDSQIALMNDTDESKHPLKYIAKINCNDAYNKAPNNTGFTNGWIYHNEEGNPVKYGDDDVVTRTGSRNGSQVALYYLTGKESNMNMAAGTSASGNNDLRKGVAIYSTRQPPVNPIKFFGKTDDGQIIELTSNELRLKYVEVPEDEESRAFTFEGSDTWTYTTKPIRVARYETTNVPMLGILKVFSGFGGQRYANSWNGLSLYNNWGTYKVNNSNGSYSSANATSGADVPLSGGGPYQHNSGYDGSDRSTGTCTYYDASSYEDNTAGNYINFEDRTYVSKAEFFYALESDYGMGYKVDANGANKTEVNVQCTEHSAQVSDTYDNRPTNSGRNYSWLRFTFTESDQRIELDKEGANTGRITYAINEDGSQDEYIKEYTVYLWHVDKDGNQTGDKEVWYKPGTISGTDTYTVEETVERVPDLEDGWYRAQIITTFVSTNSDGQQVERTKRDWSRIIQIRSAAGQPSIKATQVINENADKTKEYTLDVLLTSNVTSFAKENEDADGFEYSHITATLEIPRETGNELMIVEGDTETKATADGTVLKEEADKWVYTKSDFDADHTVLPTFKVRNTLPGQSLTYKITASISSLAGDPKSRTSNVIILAPMAKYVGTAEFNAHWVGDFNGYTAVDVPDGKFVLVDPEEPLNKATIAAETLEDYSFDFKVTYSDKEAGDVTFTATRAKSADGTIDLSEPATYLPYHPEAENLAYDDANNPVAVNEVIVGQAYDFSTQLVYHRDGSDDDSQTKAVTAQKSVIDASTLKLTSPREGLNDVKAGKAAKFIRDKDYNIVSTAHPATDYVRILTNWQEKWGGVNNQVEDALIAAEVAQPATGAVYRFDADKQTINHHDQSVFNPKNHYYSQDENDGTDLNAPGYDANDSPAYWRKQDILSKQTHVAQHPNFVERVGKEFAADAPQYSYAGNSSKLVITDPDDFADKAFKLWAGCLQDENGNYPYVKAEMDDGWKRSFAYDAYNNYGGGEFDKANAVNGYYGSRNHHVRKGWNGGEFFSREWTKQAFGNQISGSTVAEEKFTDLLSATSGVISLDQANDVLTAIKTYIYPGTGMPLYDSKYNTANFTVTDTLGVEFGRKVYLEPFGTGNGRVMLKVNHVNHESWYGHNSNVLEQWGNTLSGSSFEERRLSIRIATAHYTPVVYDFSYEYPVLATPRHMMLGSNAVMPVASKLRAAEVTGPTVDMADDVTPVTARAKGLIAFDNAFIGKGDIPTAIESVGADAGGANGRYFRYSRDTKTLTVTSTDGVGAVTVATIDGRVLKSADGNGSETFAISLADLADGYYAVVAEGVGSMKILK